MSSAAFLKKSMQWERLGTWKDPMNQGASMRHQPSKYQSAHACQPCFDQAGPRKGPQTSHVYIIFGVKRVRVIFHSPSGERQEIGAEEGQSLMEVAKAAGIDGIDADCGGSMVCGTCHVHVHPNWFDQLDQPDEMESMILECVPDPHPRARLACQIPISTKYDGLEVMVPEIQR